MKTGILAVFLFGSAVALAVLLESRAETHRSQQTGLVYLPPSGLVKYASLDHEVLAADYFWMQALQYYGNMFNRLQFFNELHRYLDLVTDLDPKFRTAYRFGAVAIPFNSGSWTWHNVEHSNRLIEKGLQQFPDDWNLLIQLGFNYGVIGTEFEKAADAYRRAAALPNAPPWVAELTARLYVTGGATERARAYAQKVLQESEDPELREAMERRLKEISVEEVLTEIDGAIERYRTDVGRNPEHLSELVASGYMRYIPQDPMGGTLFIQNGQAQSSALKGGRLRVFEEEFEKEKYR